MNDSYKVFVQMLDADGRLVAQNDSIPDSGNSPTTTWLPEQQIIDTHIIKLPATLSLGTYTIITGLYEEHSGQRLATGTTDFVTIAHLEIR